MLKKTNKTVESTGTNLLKHIATFEIIFKLPLAVMYIFCVLDVKSDNCKEVNLQNRPPLHKLKELSRLSDHV